MFSLSSRDLNADAQLPLAHVLQGMGHHGGNLSPHLTWRDAPQGTRSFAVSVFDLDAPTGSGWWHWVLINIPADVSELAQGAGSGQVALPPGALQTRTDFGLPGYGGAAPPAGRTHRYVFKVRALSVETLGLDENASGAMVSAVSGMNCLAEASLTVVYSAPAVAAVAQPQAEAA